MPKTARRFTELFSFKATAEEAQKLRVMSDETSRTPSEVIRLLIRQASISKMPDIRLGGDMS